MRKTAWRVMCVAASMVLGAMPACSSGSKPTAAAPPNADAGTAATTNVINIAHNDWLSAQLNDQIAMILLTEQLGFKVNLVDATTAGQWGSIRSGALDVSLEVWPSGHPDEMAKLAAGDPLIDFGGALGPIAKVGWFIPTYLLNTHPELATWEGFKDPNNVALFQTPSSGTQGRFMGGDPSWVQYDQQMINNLGLNFVVQFAGSEDAEIAELDSLYNKRQALLFYLWTPEWVLAKYDITMVTLPTYSDACWAKGTTNGIDCDYPADHLTKILRSGLKTAAPVAYQFFKNFSYTTKDQIDMMGWVKVQNLTVDQAARQWIAQNPTVWKAWLPAGAATATSAQ